MPKIGIQHDPAGIKAPVVHDIDNGTNLLDWLIDVFGDSEELTAGLACSVVLNGKEIFRSDHINVDNSRLDFEVNELDQVVIVNRPAITGITAATWVQIAMVVASVAMSIYTYLNMPDLPGDAEEASTSPNNRLNTASNELRAGMAIPQAFGEGVSYPDIIQPSYYMYESNIKKVYGLFCITEGEIEIPDDGEIRVGDTSFEDLPQSTAELFLPYTKPDDEYLVIHQGSENVDGQTLVAPDDDGLVKSYSLTNSNLQITGDGTTASIRISTEDIQDMGLFTDGYLYLRTEYELDDGAGDYTYPTAINGVFEIEDIVEDGSTDYSIITVLNGYQENAALVRGDVGRGDGDGVLGEGTNGNLDYWVGWYETPGEEATSVVVHLQAPSGLRKSGGGRVTIDVRIEARDVDNTDSVFIKDVTLTNNSLDAQFESIVLDSSEFSGMVAAQYEVRARRLTNDYATGAADTIKAEQFVSVTPYTVEDFGDVTILRTERKATTFSPDTSSNKINLDYIRKLPYYNRTTGVYDQDTLVATKSFADAAAYTSIVAAGADESTVNLDELYGINDGLIDEELGYFSFTFDDANVSLGERLDSICNVARVVSFQDEAQRRFTRDESKSVSSAMFNRRNVIGNDAKQAWQPQRSDDSDSVRVSYVDPDDNVEEVEERYFDTSTGEIITGDVGDVVKEIKLAGCRSQYQASNRADLEIRCLAYQRRSVEETTYREALYIDLLDRVEWVDINDADTFDGEILAIDGDNYDTTERFEPVSGVDYFVFITDDQGYPSNTVECLPRADTEFGFAASGLSGAYVADSSRDVGSRYLIASSDDMTASSFSLSARSPISDGTATINLIEYNETMYELDAKLPPSTGSLSLPSLMRFYDAGRGETNAWFRLEVDGTVDSNNRGNTDNVEYWHGSGGSDSDVGNSFEVYAEVTSGDAADITGSLDEWVTIDEDLTWSVDKLDGDSTMDVTISITIREKFYTDNTVTTSTQIAAIEMSSIDLLGDFIVYDSLNTGHSRVDIEGTGSLERSDGVGSLFTYPTTGAVTYDLGNFYQAKISNIVGDELTTNKGYDIEFNWLNLGASGLTLLLDGQAGGDELTTTFDLDVRSLDDITDTDSISVEMRANH